MAEYGPGIPFGVSCMMDKERIIRAWNGELLNGMGPDGKFTYAPASREDCLKYILSAYDNAVYHAKTAYDSGRALERLFEEVTGETTANHFRRYIALAEEERLRFQDYTYESDKENQED